MLFEKPSMAPAVVSWLSGCVLAGMAVTLEGALFSLAVGLGLGAMVLWGVGCVFAFERLVFLKLEYDASEARMNTPDEVKLIRAVAELRPDQVEVWMRHGVQMVGIPSGTGPNLVYDVDGEEIPVDFVRDFLDNCPENLKPIRDWGEGTAGRRWATILTNYFVSRGMARAASGNQAARWTVPYEAALGHFFQLDYEVAGRG